jgi:radical SAM protein with 4Fe4S-binding SPASM domain
VIWRERDPSRRLRMSPFDGLLRSAADLAAGRAARGAGCLSGACDTRFHTVDQNGYKPGCTALTAEVDNARADRNAVLRVDDPSSARRDRQIFNCNSCRFRSICSSGCLALDFDDGSGECSGGRGLLQAASALAGQGVESEDEGKYS